MLSELCFWIRCLFRAAKVEEELDQELRFHLEQKTEKYVRGGMSREEASRRVRLEFGGLDQVKEHCRDERGLSWAATLLQDVRYCVRTFRRAPGFTAITVLILALGIGATTTVFSLVDSVLLRPLPYRDASRLMMIVQRVPKEEAPAFDTYREFEEWNRYSRSFEKVAAATWARNAGAVLSWKGQKQEIMAVPVTVDFFSMLGIPAARGRTFADQDLGSSCSVVLTHRFWEERLGGAREWIGRTLTLDGLSCPILGVMPKEFSFYPNQTDLWTLITPGSIFAKDSWNMPVVVFGLLKPGISSSAAQEELEELESRIIDQAPGLAALNLKADVHNLQEEFTWLAGRNLKRGLEILFAVVVLVLLIACVNVANLLLGRAAQRQKELSLRAAIGASRLRLIRQLLTESVVLALGGAGLGTIFAYVCVQYVGTAQAAQLPPGNLVSVNWEVLAFTFLLAIGTSALFGLIPAWKATRLDLNESLKQSAPASSRGSGSQRTSRTLVVVELALSLIVLAAAGLLMQSLVRLTNAHLGYERENLLTAEIRLPVSKYSKPEEQKRFWNLLEPKILSLPGVRGAAMGLPLTATAGNETVTIEGVGSERRTVSAGGPEPVSAGYFQVLGIPLQRGRAFSEADRADSIPVAIVNETFARQFVPSGTVIGRRIKVGNEKENHPWLTIVGVVGDVARPTLFMGYARPAYVYRPLAQDPEGTLTLVVRTAGRMPGMESSIARTVVGVDCNVPTPDVQTIAQSLAWFIAEPRFRAQLFGVFAVLALLLASIGIYGVLAELVVQRTREIGIRVALGAQHRDILRLILGHGLRLILAGIALGTMSALVLTRLLARMLYGVGSADPITFTSVSLLLALVALLACYLPARGAMRMDPLAALHCD